MFDLRSLRRDLSLSRLAHGLNIVAGWLIVVSAFGCLPFMPSSMVALGLLATSLQIRSGNLLRAAPVTISLAVAIAGTFAAQYAIGGEDGITQVAEAGSCSLQRIMAGEIWRIPTSVLLHRDLGHFSSNARWLLALGMWLEPLLGSRRLLAVIGVALVASTVTTAWVIVGAYGLSGITYGLNGAVLAHPIRVAPDGKRSLDGAWMVSACLLLFGEPDSLRQFGVGAAAHMGGLVGGLLASATMQVPRWAATSRGRRLTAATVATACLLGALVTSSRWRIEQQSGKGRLAEARGDFQSASRHWTVVEDLADPGEPFDARALQEVAMYWVRRGRSEHGVTIMKAIAPTIGCNGYHRLALIQAVAAPRDERAALESWRESLALNACQPEVLTCMAQVYLFPHDSTLYSPEHARRLAWCAASQDGFRSPERLHLLASAYFYCGETTAAIRWMEAAVALDTEDRDEFERELAEMRRSS